MNTQSIQVGTCLVKDFFKIKVSVSLPDYQRPYVWDSDKLDQLYQDFEDHFFDNNIYNNNAALYYLGSVLLFENEDGTLEIIDGQQRITSLLITDYAWNTEEKFLQQNQWNLEYKSLISSANLEQNYKYIKSTSRRIKEHIQEIFSKLVFTVIITNSEDEAFTFFDSQNSRGVTLSPVDFLKSYHLRELKGKENLQEIFARKWDSNNTGQFLNDLFNLVLWRGRQWRGKNLNYEFKDAILDTFQKQTIKEKDQDTVNLYPNAFNTLSSSLTFCDMQGVVVKPNYLNLQTKADQYPFALRQPIQKGVGFFLYTEKYYAIYQILFVEKRYPHFTYLYDTLYKGVSYYFRSFFRLAIIFYYDKFKDDKLTDFGLWLDYLLGSYRIEQKSIVAQTVLKILKDKDQNLLDVIEMCYRPEDVFTFIKHITLKDSYSKRAKELGGENGVRRRYLQNNLDFFHKQTKGVKELNNKKNWINEYIINNK
ncbi:DUF262 domain-containing protein [Leeuwenhoekiella sp. NPDC079379]|uniref:DUF262 domain-containing protein n=1 Tax=Leeuwenhoekiella sp. NPDC079379 TaxID=3364122 RepID=UPI0037C818BD